MEQVTKPVEGQNDGQEMAAPQGGLQIAAIAHREAPRHLNTAERPPPTPYIASVWMGSVFPDSWSSQRGHLQEAEWSI